jgi:hypothetical protein
MQSVIYISTPTKTYADILPYVTPFANTIPDELAIEFIRQATIRFARETGVLRDIATINAEPNVLNYNVYTTESYTIDRVVGVTFSKDFINPKIEFTPPNHIKISRSVSKPQHGQVELIVVPNQSCFTIEDALYELHAKDIAAGALAEAHKLPDQPFTSLDMAIMRDREFRAAINNARTRELKKGSERSLSMKAPRFV